MDVSEKDEFPCYVISDLSKDDRFSDLSVVNGELSSYRFYAGVPITTDLGVRIGTFFVFDSRPRPEGISHSQKKCKLCPLSKQLSHS